MRQSYVLVWAVAVTRLPAFAGDLPTVEEVSQQDRQLAQVPDAKRNG